MSALSQKLSMGVAACAMAAAATLTPMPVAQAVPVASGVTGQSFAQPECNPALAICPQAVVAQATPGDFVRGIFQNNIWWFGTANPTPPPRADILVFTPLSLVPGFLKPLYSWFTKNLNFEACIFGGSIKVGPYGTTTVSIGRGCA